MSPVRMTVITARSSPSPALKLATLNCKVVGSGVGDGIGVGAGEGVGLGVGEGVGDGVGAGVGEGVGDGVGVGVGVAPGPVSVSVYAPVIFAAKELAKIV